MKNVDRENSFSLLKIFELEKEWHKRIVRSIWSQICVDVIYKIMSNSYTITHKYPSNSQLF